MICHVDSLVTYILGTQELNKHIREREELGSNDKDNDNDAFTKYILYINTL